MMLLRACLFIATLTVVVSATRLARAEILYDDSFTALDSTPVIGHTPDTTMGGASWWSTTGAPWAIYSNAALSVPGEVYLPFVPESGYVYTLEADIWTYSDGDPDADPDSGWIAFGFCSGDVISAGNPWMLQGADGGATTLFSGPGTGGMIAATPAPDPFGTTYEYSVVLDTRPTLWTAEWLRDGVQLGTHTYAANPTITDLTMRGYATQTGALDNFTLTREVPEPSTLALLLGGAVILILVRRHRG